MVTLVPGLPLMVPATFSKVKGPTGVLFTLKITSPAFTPALSAGVPVKGAITTLRPSLIPIWIPTPP